MSVLGKKLVQRLTDPIFYRKNSSGLLRRFRRFQDNPAPLVVEEMPWRKVAVVVAHPDDETFCSGLICELVDHGVEVEIFCLTRGEGGPTGGMERSLLGEAREKEMRAACEILGVARVEFLHHIDPVADGVRVFAPDVKVSELSDQLAANIGSVDLVVCHGSSGEYWHPAHLLVFEAVAHWINSKRMPLDWLTFLARQPDHVMPRLVNWDDDAHYCLDVGKYQTIREKSLGCHASQIGLFGRFANGEFRDFIRKTSVETFRLQKRSFR